MLTSTHLRSCTMVLLILMIGFPSEPVFADESAVLFHIECPDDVTVDCTYDIWDLSDFGWAYVYGYGGPVPAGDPVVHYNINSCGTGTITRTWTAYDYSGYPYSCTQTIYVGSYGGFDESNIHWPPDYHTYDCHASFHPDDLPHPYNYPTWNDVPCSMIMVGYEDLVWNPGGCTKVLRTWKVIDWCTYEPNNPYSGGRWEHVQVLKVKSHDGIQLDCGEDVTVSANIDCSGAYVHLDPVTGVGACGSEVTITNLSPYADQPGPDASGFYPVGTTKVKFRAEDECGNWEHCHIYVTVKDLKKPTPVCLHGITANLMINPDGGYYIDLEGEWFDNGSWDNCTPNELLAFDIEPKRFTCDELGHNDVRVTVTDLHGNTQYCNTYVIIQDNMGMCPPPDTSTHAVSGKVVYRDGVNLEGVKIVLLGENGEWVVLSDENGNFMFRHVPGSEDYSLYPLVDGHFRDGISTYDLILIARYILGYDELSDPVQMLASDVNMDGSIDVLDIATLRNLLLYKIDAFDHNLSWRFLPEGYSFSDPGHPLSEWVPVIFDIPDLQGPVSGIDYLGYKLGDLNFSAGTDGSVESRSLDQWQLNLPDAELSSGESHDLPIYAASDLSVRGIQMSLRFNPAEVSILSVTGDACTSWSKNAYRIDHERGLLHISWISPVAIDIQATDPLFRIQARSVEAVASRDLLALDGDHLQAEAYSADGTYSLLLGTAAQDSEPVALDGLRVYPNPSRASVYVETGKSWTGPSDILVKDMSGRTLYTRNMPEYGILEIPRDVFGQSGIYVLEITNDQGRRVEKLMIH